MLFWPRPVGCNSFRPVLTKCQDRAVMGILIDLLTLKCQLVLDVLERDSETVQYPTMLYMLYADKDDMRYNQLTNIT